jgi:hypothetical protein
MPLLMIYSLPRLFSCRLAGTMASSSVGHILGSRDEARFLWAASKALLVGEASSCRVTRLSGIGWRVDVGVMKPALGLMERLEKNLALLGDGGVV